MILSLLILPSVLSGIEYDQSWALKCSSHGGTSSLQALETEETWATKFK